MNMQVSPRQVGSAVCVCLYIAVVLVIGLSLTHATDIDWRSSAPVVLKPFIRQ